MGYRGKVAEQRRARELRAQAWTLQDIATELGVSKSSVSVWVRDVEFVPNPRRAGRRRSPSRLQLAKQEEIEALLAEGRERIGRLTEREFLVAGTALYAGEGTKADGKVGFTNTNPELVAFFLAWLRHFWTIDERRLRLWLYLHEGLDLDSANGYWSVLTGIPLSQFGKPYRAAPDPTARRSKHEMGCPRVSYSCTSTHRAVMGLVSALLSCDLASFRGSSTGRALGC